MEMVGRGRMTVVVVLAMMVLSDAAVFYPFEDHQVELTCFQRAYQCFSASL